jgi:hypothetical protein
MGGVSEPSTEGWQLHGIVKSAVTADVGGVHFGDEAVRGQPPAKRKIRAAVHVLDAELRARATPDLVDIRVTRGAGTPTPFEVEIAPKPRLPAGRFSCKVRLDAVSAEGGVLPGLTLAVDGTIQPPVRALPAQVLLGFKKVGEVAEAAITLQVPAGEEWVVDHIEVESPDVSVETPGDKDLGSARKFRIRQRITKEGRQASAVRFFLRKGGAPEPLTCEIIYEGGAVTRPAGALRGSKP